MAKFSRQSVRSGSEGPVIYLLDESHHDLASTSENIALASRLHGFGLIDFVGVEGYMTLSEFERTRAKYTSKPATDPMDDRLRIGAFPQLAAAMVARGCPVRGVDSQELCDLIELDVYASNGKMSTSAHPEQLTRSLYFLEALLAAGQDLRAERGMLLNCGANHNKHIRALAESPAYPERGWPDLTILRLRPPSHPLGPLPAEAP